MKSKEFVKNYKQPFSEYCPCVIDWNGEIYLCSKGHLETLVESISQERQEFRCKSIATIYEYFDIDNNGIRIKPHKTKELEQFLNDSEKYSVEHFIINDSGKCECKLSTNATFEYEYPEEIKKDYSLMYQKNIYQ